MVARKRKSKLPKTQDVLPEHLNNYVLISDMHVGCQYALCHPDGFELDGGGMSEPSADQKVLWDRWTEFWNVWVPSVTLGAPYAVVNLGDVIDGVHHNSVTQITHNVGCQRQHAVKILKPVAQGAVAYYHVRGTEAHVGKSAQEEETVARELGAVPDSAGCHARYELWFRVGNDSGGGLVHAMHHIGTTGSSHYESSAVMRELTEAFVEAGRWGDEPPRIIARAHRHRHIQIRIPGGAGDCIGMTTPAWQLKTPFSHAIAGGRMSQAQIGGCIVRYHRGELYVRNKVWRGVRPKEVG